MYWRKLYVVPLVITLVLAGAFLLAGVISGPGAARTFATQGPQSHVGSYASAQGSSPQQRVLHESDVPGSPAIQPDPAKVGLGPSTPAFSAEDAARFVNRTHGIGLVDGIDPNTPVTVGKIAFLTERDLKARHIGHTGRPDDALLCSVELHGSFTVIGSPHVATQQGCPRAYVIFDAHTGNRLMYAVDCDNLVNSP